MPARKPKRPAPDTILAALERSVLASPDEDTPRLLYADRLDELAEPGSPEAGRAAFIRAQCDLARLNEWDEGYVEAEQTARLLEERFEEAWHVPALTRELMRATGRTPGVFRPFVRGFPERIWANVGSFDRARRALARYPIRELYLNAYGRKAVANVAAVVAESGAVTLDLWAPDRELAVVRALADGPPLPRLKRLEIDSDVPTPDALERLITSAAFPNLEALKLRSDLDEAAMLVVARRMRLPKLRDLTLFGPLTPAVSAALAAAEWVERLTRLCVVVPTPGEGEARPECDTAPLFASKRLGNLRALELLDCPFHTDTARAVAAAKSLGPLDALELSWHVDLATPAFRALARAPALAGVKSLSLPCPRDPDAAIEAVGTFRELRKLDWIGKALTPRGVAALARSPAARSLRRLKTWSLSLTPETVRELCAGPPWPHLAELLKVPRSDGRAVAKLIDHPNFARLVSLDVHGAAGARELVDRVAASESVARFRKLRLDFPVTDALVRRLLDSPHVRRVGHLALPNRDRVTPATRRRYEKHFGLRLAWDF